MDALVVHYHELGLKGRNRDFFERTLAQNLKRALRGTGYSKLRRGFGRIVVDFEPEARVGLAAERAAKVFGVAYVGAGRRVEPELDAIGDTALELMLAEPFESFAVRSRRTHSTCTHKSSEIQEVVGARIKEASGARVDLRNAEATAWVELFAGAGIVYRKRLRGPGGLPAGTSGRMLALLSGGIDSPVAAWRMALRGADVQFLHFHGQPYSDPSSVRQAADLAQVLARYQMRAVLHLVPLGDVQREIVTECPANLRVILYRRMMMRIAERLATDLGAQALVTGDSLGQVASQTIENIRTVDAAVPGAEVLRPLVGMDKQEIVDLATRIGTYEISTRKHQDCCVLFEPRSPATKTHPGQADAAEAGLDVETLIGKALSGIETQVYELEPPD
ncbi:MAG TPA: tRNA uracil 4-sulfurtransferase ThiI [Actinomycetota bacterium]|nr:tRNA uracil 4-sulfurtransferase ThiI [Actinomycetota bacterium]